MKNLLIASICVFVLGCKSGSDAGEPMPAFEILLPDGITHMNTAKIEEGHPIALMYFSPDCEHCQAETEGIIKNIDSLKSVKFFFVTNEDFEEMKIFGAHYGLDKYPNITFGRDDQFFMIRHFKGIFPPYLILYDKNKKQKKIFNGQTTASDLTAAVNQL